MFSILIALIVLAVAVGAIYLLLKSMGEEGIEVAAPGSCKSGRCGVRCAPLTDARDEEVEEIPPETEEVKRKESA
jgi:hypothetical protein